MIILLEGHAISFVRRGLSSSSQSRNAFLKENQKVKTFNFNFGFTSLLTSGLEKTYDKLQEAPIELRGLIHHFTYSIQFLNEENDREDDGLTLGLQLCYRIVWP